MVQTLTHHCWGVILGGKLSACEHNTASVEREPETYDSKPLHCEVPVSHIEVQEFFSGVTLATTRPRSMKRSKSSIRVKM